jgi:hypothetical protein
MDAIRIVAAGERDTPIIVEMIRALAEYERLSHLVGATEERIRTTLFGPKSGAEVRSATAASIWRPLREASSARQGSRRGALAHLASLAKPKNATAGA